MYQSEQFHTSNYRGNQPGHDNYLRSDSQSPSSFGSSQNVTSQYKGMQKSFQPTGLVNSVYGQQNQNPASFHTANYRGDQPNHDNYLRADSTQPTQTGYSTVNSSANYGFTSNTGFGSVPYGQNQQGQQYQTQYVSPNSYHTANYKGDQPNHDAYLRSDSFQPTQGQFTSAYGQSSIPQQQFRTQSQSFSTGNYGMNSGFVNNSQQSFGQQQFVSPASYHTANYKGDQPNHDAYLRSDSAQTAQSQFGSSGMGSNFSSYNKF